MFWFLCGVALVLGVVYVQVRNMDDQRLQDLQDIMVQDLPDGK
jgi:hypothetical protein